MKRLLRYLENQCSVVNKLTLLLQALGSSVSVPIFLSMDTMLNKYHELQELLAVRQKLLKTLIFISQREDEELLSLTSQLYLNMPQSLLSYCASITML